MSRLADIFTANSPGETWYRRGSLAIMLGFLLLIAYLFDDAGISWDEKVQLIWGDAAWQFYSEVLSGQRHLFDGSDLKGSVVHPIFFDLVNAGARRILPFSDYLTGHLLSALFGWSGLVAVWLIARRFAGERGGFWALVLLLCLPRYFGHLWFNPKDIPFAATHAWALWALLRCVGEFPRPRWSTLALFGVLTGLALGVRLAALLLFGYYGLAATAWAFKGALARNADAPDGETAPRERVVRAGQNWLQLALRGSVALGAAWLVVLPFWPGIWLDMESRGGSSATDALQRAQAFDWDYPVRFAGEVVNASELPRTYLPHWIAITVPVFTLLLLLAGLCLLVRWLREHGKLPERWAKHHFELGVVILGAVFPVCYVVATKPVLYDGMRHFIFVLPPMAVLAGLSLVAGADWLEKRQRRLAALLPALAGAFAIWMSLHYAQMHPLAYISFNRLVGGTGGAAPSYETEYWGLSFREGVEALDEIIDYTYPEDPPEIVVYVPLTVPEWLFRPFFPEHFTMTREPVEAHFAMAFDRFGLMRPIAHAPLIAEVERDGATLLVVRLLSTPPGFREGLRQAIQKPLPADAPEMLLRLKAGSSS
ncbi:MAG: ArnT family glycosyltransferase [Opitutales bacterium]